jgi:hypothetical protein
MVETMHMPAVHEELAAFLNEQDQEHEAASLAASETIHNELIPVNLSTMLGEDLVMTSIVLDEKKVRFTPRSWLNSNHNAHSFAVYVYPSVRDIIVLG